MKTHLARKISGASAAELAAIVAWNSFAAGLTYPVVGTGQTQCHDNSRVIAAPRPGRP